MSNDVLSFLRDRTITRAAMRDYRADADRIEREAAEMPPYMGLSRKVMLNYARIARHAAQAEYFNPRSEDDR